jgi:glutamyl-Q tRNA(Asp) synthetase
LITRLLHAVIALELPKVAVRGRFAPSPTGALHFGSLVAALGSYLSARAQHGEWLLRIDDIDPPREVPGAQSQILAQLQALGLAHDAPLWRQSQRFAQYRAALQTLEQADLTFRCTCSRSQLHGRPHRGRCRAKAQAPACIRLDLAATLRHTGSDTELCFDDAIVGTVQQDLPAQVGDFVLWRVEGWPSYQLACVVDDLAAGITEVVRGADLIEVTPRQILLQRAFGGAAPRYAHLPLALGADGQKLSKQNLAPALCIARARADLAAALSFLNQPKVLSDRDTPEELLKAATNQWQLGRISRSHLAKSQGPDPALAGEEVRDYLRTPSSR